MYSSSFEGHIIYCQIDFLKVIMILNHYDNHNKWTKNDVQLFVAAGTDTTRSTLAWIWQYLAAFPEVQARAQQEVDSVLGNMIFELG